MRLKTKGGFLLRDRFGRGKVALAALAALLISATTARAAVYDLQIDPALSTLTNLETLDLTAFKLGKVVLTNQSAFLGPGAAGSLTTSFFGSLLADINGSVGSGSIQLLPGSMINANQYLNGAQPLFPGENASGQPGMPAGPPFFGQPTVANPQPGDWGQLGIQANLVQRTDRLRYDVVQPGQIPSLPALGNTAMPVTAGTFDASTQAMWMVEGYQDVVSALANSHTKLQTAGDSSTPFPTPVGNNTGGSTGTWDGTTLTLPVNSILTFVISGVVPTTVQITGTIVAHVRVPEPSTMTLFGFGVVGLLSYAWRARKRRVLTA